MPCHSLGILTPPPPPSRSALQPSKAYLKATHAVTSPSPKTAPFLAKGEQYLLPVYARPDFVLEKGKGCWVWDVDGNKYLDFTAGIAVNSLGHSDEGVSKVCAFPSFDSFAMCSRPSYFVWDETARS